MQEFDCENQLVKTEGMAFKKAQKLLNYTRFWLSTFLLYIKIQSTQITTWVWQRPPLILASVLGDKF